MADEEKKEAEAAQTPENGEAAATETPPAEAAEGDAAAAQAALPPIIVIKKVIDEGHGGAHGGAWKIALADMMTAMMAFFLLMWLLGSTNEDQRKSIADYFRPTSHSQVSLGQTAGSSGLLGGTSIIDPEGFKFTAKQTALLERVTPRSEAGPSTSDGSSQDPKNREGKSEDLSKEEKKKVAAEVDKENFDKLEKEIKENMKENKQLAKLKDQVTFTREADGLRIDIIDKADFSMFPLGSDRLEGRAAALIREVAKSLKDMPNKVAVTGHTDSVSFAPDSGKNNWSLSAERAEATRKILESGGLSDKRFAKIEGVADTMPFNPKDRADPRNRRMSVKVLYQNVN
ncbi:MAG: flagellar motor protein [Betaproteobacteria bacterium]|nr:flagellar motor protein [Betaproteobacteria bacterium]NBT75899.1 flagellar motor protein [Betaproteobacteria bacterium]NBY14490.1 flagellar motor protein [Betaproteobacteria bacterium]NCA16404.1 flagellar motor protein [Betaproteobacteria bacterium]